MDNHIVFLMRGENKIPKGKTSSVSRYENQENRSTHGGFLCYAFRKKTIRYWKTVSFPGTADWEGLVDLQPYHLFAWVNFLGSRIKMHDKWRNSDP